MIYTTTNRAIRHLIERRLGLSAKTLAHSGLDDVLKQFGDNPDDVLHTLEHADDNSDLWQRLIHALTIGETYFLRDKAHFQVLREAILPDLLADRRQQGQQRLTIWSMGCSTGEEAYSIATTLYEMIPDWQAWDITLIASDVNQRSIMAARQGYYRAWSFRHVPPAYQACYFTQQGDDHWQIVPHIRDLVTFRRMNVLDGSACQQADIIFARHVLMYFDEGHIAQAEDHLYHALQPDGWLFLGQAEVIHHRRERWLLHMFPGTPVYQKTLATGDATEPIPYPLMVDDEDDETIQPNLTTILYEKAVAALRDDAAQLAETYLGQLLDEQPTHAAARVLIAALIASRQAYPEAMTHLNMVLAHDAQVSDAHYMLALIASEQGFDQQAIAHLKMALHCDRDHVLAAFMLGHLYHHQGNEPGARHQWQQALARLEQRQDDVYLSDLSDLTVAHIRRLLQTQLATLRR